MAEEVLYRHATPGTLVTTLNDMINTISDMTGSAAAITFNSFELSANSLTYLVTFNSGSWIGDIIAYELNSNNGEITTTSPWTAGNKLDARDLGSLPRTILTYDGSDGILLNGLI